MRALGTKTADGLIVEHRGRDGNYSPPADLQSFPTVSTYNSSSISSIAHQPQRRNHTQRSRIALNRLVGSYASDQLNISAIARSFRARLKARRQSKRRPVVNRKLTEAQKPAVCLYPDRLDAIKTSARYSMLIDYANLIIRRPHHELSRIVSYVITSMTCNLHAARQHLISNLRTSRHSLSQ